MDHEVCFFVKSSHDGQQINTNSEYEHLEKLKLFANHCLHWKCFLKWGFEI